MNSTDHQSVHRSRAIPRSSLACLPCRSQRRKCDGIRPHCSRCAEAAVQCHYSASRRGGLDRAALAERRKQLAAVAGGSSTTDPASSSSPSVASRAGTQPQDHDQTDRFAEVNIEHGYSSHVASSSGVSSASLNTSSCTVEFDSLVDSYYQNFHRFHPLLVPSPHLSRLFQNPSQQPSITPLIAVLRFIGHLSSGGEWSTPLKDSVEACFAEASQTDPFMVQCRLLFSIALFWCGNTTDSQREIDAAVRLALHLEMFRREFATERGDGDAVLTESWRRTWWMLFVIDGYYAGTLGTMKSSFAGIEATMELPCEELEFESGEIPKPRTLQDFDCREFANGTTSFSSFAYLVGAVRCAMLATSTVRATTNKEASAQVIQAADSIVDGWLLLLPKQRKQVLTKNGQIDELMFQAHLVIHVSTINLHRPLSDLKFNRVEEISTCAREPPPDTPVPELVNVHTVRVLRSVEAQISLIALPARPFNHTPFVTCMISEGTLALLSACNFLLKGKELAIARDQIRMTVGCLRTLGEVWPRTARNLQEIQTIARHVLGLESKAGTNDTLQSTEVPNIAGGEAEIAFESGLTASNMDVFAAIDAADNAYGWCKFGNLDLELSRWMEE
ncbi:hypothetical protein BP5796_12834 [Coleophoma crateriformis]|uniref:Zn(2)-C6 fungal-type domain-containing protein n=1 Tax=Coleophoma crateriformis TaxID=565419 RepID=A0A3D8Q7I3_9HELO|nr:hypothetical protein BP5796_12834 [Coleophoma crateriformis]